MTENSHNNYKVCFKKANGVRKWLRTEEKNVQLVRSVADATGFDKYAEAMKSAVEAAEYCWQCSIEVGRLNNMMKVPIDWDGIKYELEKDERIKHRRTRLECKRDSSRT